MKRKRKGFGFGAKADSNLKRDKRQKKKEPVRRSHWGSKKSKAKETPDHSPIKHRPSYDVQEIEIADIIVKGKRRALDPAKLKELMESITSLGLRTPITVSVVKRRRDWGSSKREYLLNTGWHRLEAKKRLGETTIPCIIMEGDEHDARKWEISENLHRAELTPLESDEQIVEWVRLTEADKPIFGQTVQKKGRGRPKGGISEAARKLPVKGKTHAGKRRTVERAFKVVGLLPEARDAVEKAGLDKNRSKFRKVAAEKTLEAQLAMVRELTARKSKTGEKRSSFGTKQQATKADSKTALSAEEEKALEILIDAWNDAPELKQAFIEASPTVREQFIAKIRGDVSPGAPRDDRSKRSQWA